MFDLESIILTGRIVERQADRTFGTWKCLFTGETETATLASVVARLGSGGWLVVLTAYLEDHE